MNLDKKIIKSSTKPNQGGAKTSIQDNLLAEAHKAWDHMYSFDDIKYSTDDGSGCIGLYFSKEPEADKARTELPLSWKNNRLLVYFVATPTEEEK